MVAVVLGLGWWHYTGLRSDLATARVELVAARAEMRAAIEIAENNLIELRRAEAQHRASIDTRESAFTALSDNAARSREAETIINSAPAERDGDVASLLDDLRIGRFGGQP